MAKKILNPVELLHELLDDLQLIQLKGSKCGASEKSVDSLIGDALRAALKNKEGFIPNTLEAWGLIERCGPVLNSVEVMRIAVNLTNQLNKCIDLINKEYKEKEHLFAMGKVVRDFYED